MKSKVDGDNFWMARCAFLLGLLCLLGFPAAAAAADYTVHPGDSLYVISMHYHTTVEALQSANGLDGSVIYPGQKLTIPETGKTARPAARIAALPAKPKARGVSTALRRPAAGAQAKATPADKPAVAGATSYQVQSGDSLYRIGLRFGVDDQAIIRANGLTSALIYPGQSLLIPGATGGAASGGVTAKTAAGGASSDNAAAGGVPAPEALSRGAAVDARDVLAKADSLLGRPYVYGAAGPATFDCSGFTMFVFNSAGIALPHNAADQAMLGRAVDRSALEPGDLVFFSYNGSKDIEHVGIYAGNDRFIHASSTGGVKYSSLDESYYAANFREARRLLRQA